ncbi:MAG TPA: response regulator, partial [Pseudomonadales bacterium]
MAIKTRYNEAIRLLILHDSQDEAEQLINELRNFGHATRAHQIEDEEDLLDVLNGGVWDLFLSRPETKQISVSTVLTHLKKLNKDIPLIILSDDNDSETITSGLQAGAQDVVPATERERLKLVVTRELNNLYDRRLRHKSEQAL